MTYDEQSHIFAESYNDKPFLDSLTAAEQERLISAVKKGLPVLPAGYDNEIPADCFSILSKDKDNIAKSADGVFVAINTEITPRLKDEGIYREILRHCQLLRKEAGFAVIDRVALSFETASESIKSVVKSYAKDIAHEALSEIRDTPTPVMQKTVDLDGEAVIISIAQA